MLFEHLHIIEKYFKSTYGDDFKKVMGLYRKYRGAYINKPELKDLLNVENFEKNLMAIGEEIGVDIKTLSSNQLRVFFDVFIFFPMLSYAADIGHIKAEQVFAEENKNLYIAYKDLFSDYKRNVSKRTNTKSKENTDIQHSTMTPSWAKHVFNGDFRLVSDDGLKTHEDDGIWKLFHVKNFEDMVAFRDHVGWCIAASKELFASYGSDDGIHVLQYYPTDLSKNDITCVNKLESVNAEVKQNCSYSTVERILTYPIAVAFIAKYKEHEEDEDDDSIDKRITIKNFYSLKNNVRVYVKDPKKLRAIFENFLDHNINISNRPYYVSEQLEDIKDKSNRRNKYSGNYNHLIETIQHYDIIKPLEQEINSIISTYHSDYEDQLRENSDEDGEYQGEGMEEFIGNITYNYIYQQLKEKILDTLIKLSTIGYSIKASTDKTDNIYFQEIQINTNDYRYQGSDNKELFTNEFVGKKLLSEKDISTLFDTITDNMNQKPDTEKKEELFDTKNDISISKIHTFYVEFLDYIDQLIASDLGEKFYE